MAQPQAGSARAMLTAEPQNYKIREWFGLEGALKIISFQPSAMGVALDQVIPALIQPGLEHSQGQVGRETPALLGLEAEQIPARRVLHALAQDSAQSRADTGANLKHPTKHQSTKL